MTVQGEALLEQSLVEQLACLGYEPVTIRDEAGLLSNLKRQLEIHNKTGLSDSDFRQILNYIGRGNIFERAKVLRDRVPYVTDEGESRTVELIDQVKWCKNEFQVTEQVTVEGSYRNRYDVTILVNGLPLVQIELKRRGLELKEAFNQTNRYDRHSYGAGAGLFRFIQFFVISNGVDTKYYANTPVKARDFKQTFYWSDRDNRLITPLADFTAAFLEPCHLSRMITRYVVLNESRKCLMVLRPYQFYAVEALIERVKSDGGNGYIWHTTGSGKTLTSFKAAQILTELPEVHTVIFVVDRKDLDYQTTREFNSFKKDSIDGTANTDALVRQMTGGDKLIVTTIQKLSNAIAKRKYIAGMETLKDKRIIFIFDECHRSQFGKTHEEIRGFFSGCRMFGFTGTPIFAENAGTNEYGRRTTAMLFDRMLHRYVITDAIRDENVLKFSIEYIRTFRKRDHIVDIEVEDIDRAEVMNAPERLEKIVDYIIDHHSRKTHGREFNAIFAVSSVDTLIEYYRIFREKAEAGLHDLSVATIFSYRPNEDDRDVASFVDDELPEAAEGAPEYDFKHSRDALEECIGHYNKRFSTNFNTRDSRSFYNYYEDIGKRVRHRQVDILLVVNMFLTGFDSPDLNTLYVDKNLRHHGLIQAYSRTNRIRGELKSQGNIVVFRNLKTATDEAVALFADQDAKETIILGPYEDYVRRFNEAFLELLKIAPTVKSVNDLADEEEELAFIRAFRELMRIMNVLKTFGAFRFDDLSMPEQLFEDYKSKYLDLWDKVKTYTRKERVSILQDIDFELELIHRDEINVAYILRLLARLRDSGEDEWEDRKKAILDLLSSEAKLRSKRELIERFINENLPYIEDSDDIGDAFEAFWSRQQALALDSLCREEDLDPDRLRQVLSTYLFTEKVPLRDEIIALRNTRTPLKERKAVAERITARLMDFVETFISGIAAA